MALFNSGSAGATRPSPTQQEGGPMGLKEYDVEVNGQATTLLLSEEDARAQGLLKPESERSKLAELKSQLAEAEAKAAAAEEKERAAVAAKDEAEAKLAAAEEKAKELAANKQAAAPQNKGGSATGQKADG